MEYSPKKMQEMLLNNGFNLKKKFGQNFIIDENIIKNIILKSEIDKETLVIEIGPGAGSLTYGLAKNAKNVICYEIDTTLEQILKENLKDFDNVDVFYKDFLQANVAEDLKKYDYSKLYVVANLPYYITTPIIMKLIDDKIDVDKIVIMVQKEVGDRFKAVPGSKDYSSLSIFLKYYFEVSKIMDVSKNIFLPKPNVDSIVVAFTKQKSKIYVKNEELFFKLVRDSFKQKRKTIRNNLKDYNLDIIGNILEKNGLDLTIRAEQVSIEIFADIANNLG